MYTVCDGKIQVKLFNFYNKLMSLTRRLSGGNSEPNNQKQKEEKTSTAELKY